MSYFFPFKKYNYGIEIWIMYTKKKPTSEYCWKFDYFFLTSESVQEYVRSQLGFF